jgi:hypothetical protein
VVSAVQLMGVALYSHLSAPEVMLSGGIIAGSTGRSLHHIYHV